MDIGEITLSQIVAAIAIIGAITGFVTGLVKLYKNNITVRFEKLENNIEELKSIQKEQKEEIENSKDERYILLKGILACLDGLKQNGANGPVTDAIDEINKYLLKRTRD